MSKSVTEAKQAARLAEAVPLIERIEALDARLSAIEGARRSLRGLLPRGELVERVTSWLRALRASIEAPADSMRPDIGDMLRALSADPPRAVKIRDEQHVLGLVVWMLGDLLEEGAARAVARLDYPQGPPSETRHRLAAELAAEREALVAERRGLVERAAEAGVEVAHLAETAATIEHERVVAEREALQAAADRRREAEIDARHGTASRYLAGA